MDLQSIKQRFEIIGNSPLLNRAIEKAVQVAPTDISVLVTGESGVGKENIPKIIHSQSARKHNPYIAVNCGAIPEGTIDSELFGHEKGSFTGATSARKGYFEEADSGTIFLDEVAELPLSTQVRLLRVLETGEFMKVGSSKVQKTDVRIVAATNVPMDEAIGKDHFREDLYYRLNTVEIHLPPLRDRAEDIHLLFRKFASDFANKYHMPTLQLNNEAVELINHYRWPGNIRQLKNFTEEISVIETERIVTAQTIQRYLPESARSNLPMIYRDRSGTSSESDFSSERDILYKVLFDMRNDINDLKKLTMELMKEGGPTGEEFRQENAQLLAKVYDNFDDDTTIEIPDRTSNVPSTINTDIYEDDQVIEESLTLQDKEIEMIRKALDRNQGKRKDAAKELGISERTLYRKIKQYDL
ncbi:MAG: sigma-54-dependent Fis family transcriptional regulator [Flavobacteriales bacterium]|nr:sigma-54-dependent Fis family transcriptional regulator [Flavobacteriales bacterium]